MSAPRRATLAVSAGRPAHEPGNPVNAPIGASVTFHAGKDPVYLRQTGSDVLQGLEEAIGALEGGRALAFSSGMGATAAALDAVPVGAVVVAPRMCYSGTSSLLERHVADGRLVVRFVEISDTAAVVAALEAEPAPALLWVETPTNPLVGIADLPALVAAAHRVGAAVAVDSTWNSPVLLRPLEHGADLVMHSATKYLGGHSDLLMGVLVTADDARFDDLLRRRTLGGAFPGTLECFLALRGLRTLDVRMERAQANAGELARRLDADPRVEKVLYPGLPDFPGHDIVARDHDGFGAMMSFLVAGGADAAEAVCGRVRLVSHGTSLGGVESLLERRARYAVDAANGTPENLLRFSVGIEHVEDLWSDLDQALG
ncbi:PLP-dependent transferase [Nakamurella sp. YIM 132087]|uniref:PLP-dependent transferase n=1 Tax=Nakamurella alba TaxID=2665158 RepID=A0A7K1FLJ4_9ACTN|nr:PLP-dependent aspartate aminotransferase family protein [Nakamurella alba]MTD14259.1 PLP-dependent transferase [Nakamurella alba]